MVTRADHRSLKRIGFIPTSTWCWGPTSVRASLMFRIKLAGLPGSGNGGGFGTGPRRVGREGRLEDAARQDAFFKATPGASYLDPGAAQLGPGSVRWFWRGVRGVPCIRRLPVPGERQGLSQISTEANMADLNGNLLVA